MRLLLDECLPGKLKGGLPGHDVKTVPEMGWASVENGDLLPLMPQVMAALPSIEPEQIVKIAIQTL